MRSLLHTSPTIKAMTLGVYITRLKIFPLRAATRRDEVILHSKSPKPLENAKIGGNLIKTTKGHHYEIKNVNFKKSNSS